MLGIIRDLLFVSFWSPGGCSVRRDYMIVDSRMKIVEKKLRPQTLYKKRQSALDCHDSCKNVFVSEPAEPLLPLDPLADALNQGVRITSSVSSSV